MDDYKCTAFFSFSESVGGMTALHLACLWNRPNVVKLLLQAGAGDESGPFICVLGILVQNVNTVNSKTHAIVSSVIIVKFN